MKKKNKIIFFSILMIIGILLRIGLYYFGMDKVNINGLTGGYLHEADTVLNTTHWFYDTIAGMMVLNTNHPKGYSFLIVILKLLFSENWLVAMHWVNAIVDSMTAIMLFLICKHTFKKESIGYIASVIYIFCPLTIINSVQELPDAFAIFLLSLLIYVWIKPQKNNYIKYIYLGVTAGICSYFRAELVFVVYILIFCDLVKNLNIKKVLIEFGIVFISLQILAMPWGLYTYSQTGRYITGSTSAWGSAYEALGQNPNIKEDIVLNDIWLNEHALKHGFYGAFNYEANEYYKKQFINYVLKYPYNYIETIVKYRLEDAFFPRTFAIFNLNRLNEQVSNRITEFYKISRRHLC